MYHIVFCGDEKYIKFISVVIYSILKNTNPSVSYKDRLPYALADGEENQIEQYHFHIISSQLSAETIKKIQLLEEKCQRIFPCRIEVHLIDETIFNKYPQWNGSYGAYYRLLLGDILEPQIKYCLYLDGDMGVFSDIREIFLNDISKVCLGAVVENDQEEMQEKGNRFCIKSRTGGNDYHLYDKKLYFNTGMLLINKKLWNENCIKDNVLQFLNSYYAYAPDQDGINAVVGDNFKKLGFEWNVFCYDNFAYHFKRLYHAIIQYDKTFHYENTIKIRHYFLKPWNTDSRHFSHFKMIKLLLHDEWWELAQNTPVFSEEIMSIKESDEYKQKVKKNTRRAFRYKCFKFYYWLLYLKRYKMKKL